VIIRYPDNVRVVWSLDEAKSIAYAWAVQACIERLRVVEPPADLVAAIQRNRRTA